LAPRTTDLILKIPGLSTFQGRVFQDVESPLVSINDHVIIVGFGVCGRNLARAARIGQIPYRILEMNPETVREEREKGEPILFGDATQETVLETAGLNRARVLTIVINDAAAVRRITDLARRMNPNLYIIIRTRFFHEVDPLYALGADEVIPEEFETAVEIFTRLLKKYLVPQEDINRLTAEVRSEGYQMFRATTLSGLSLEELKRHVPDMDIQTFRIGMYSTAAAKTLAEMNLRKDYGVSVLATRRGTEMLVNPDGEMRGRPDDLWFVMGSPDQLDRVAPLFANPGGRGAKP
jgi:CPA2 family monovalent cation:H+ antiporter-2